MTVNKSGIDEVAARWAVRLTAAPLNAEEQGELDLWLAADARHRGALLRARAAWLDLDRLSALRGRGASVTFDQPPIAVQTASRRWFVAASLATLGLAGLGSWWIRRRDSEEYVSEIGEVRRVTLSDGSTMLLNTASHVIVTFEKTREVHLISGEGLFEVAKDPARPFIVHTGTVSVRAVGTMFGVRAGDQHVDVTVTEGVVEVTAAPDERTNSVRRVTANERAIVNAAQEVEVQTIRSDQAERQFAWRDGMVNFDGEPLADAIDEINRHNRRRIVIDDAALGSRPVVGVFRASDADGFAATVAAALGAQRVDAGEKIHLRLRATQ
jgi:transmembrane sensor